MTPDEVRRATKAAREDPQLLLAQAQVLDQAVALAGKEELSESLVCPVLEQLRHYFLHGLLQHLNEEEQEFFPAVDHLPEGERKRDRLERDHALLRLAVENFKGSLALTRYVGAQTRQAILWRIVAEARQLLTQLKGHAAFEADLVKELHALATADAGVGN